MKKGTVQEDSDFKILWYCFIMNIEDIDEDDIWKHMFIAEFCNLDFDDYLLDKKILTRDIIEENLDDIVVYLESSRFNKKESNRMGDLIYDVEIHNAYQVLSVLILETGSKLPDIVRDSVLESTEWNFDRRKGWRAPKLRRFYLDDFRKKIISYKPGVSTYLIDLKVGTDFQFKNTCVGIKNFHKLSRSKRIRKISYINLDSCQIKEFPPKLFELTHIVELSLERNYLTTIPRDILKLANLEYLWLSNNLLEEVPLYISELKSLKVVCLTGNPLINSESLDKSDIKITY